MHIREKQISGQSFYEIVEEVALPRRVEYRVIVSLGNDSEPENARRRRHATLLSLERSLQRIEPLRDADPQIARKCDTLIQRIDREKQKIALLTDAIESLGGAPAGPSEARNKPSNIQALKLISDSPAEMELPEPGD